MKDTPDDAKQDSRASKKRLQVDSKSIKRRLKKVETSTTRHAKKFIVKRIENVKASRRYIIAWLVLVSVILVGIAVNFFLIDRQYMTRADVPGGTYAEGVIGKLETLNPLYVSSSAEGAAAKLMFSSLYDYDTTGKLHPDIAESMQITEKGRRYTVKVRKDVKWHDGETLTAKDVAFTIKLMKNPDIRARTSLQSSWRDVKVKLIDDYTIDFELAPYAAFPHALTFSILPEHILSQISFAGLRESNYSKAPVGSGPFSFKLLQSGANKETRRTLHLVANEEYYQGAPFVSRFELHAYQKTDQLMRAVESSEITGAIGLDEIQAANIKNSNYHRIDVPINSGIYLLMNTKQSFLKDVKVRQAIQRIVDTEKIRKESSSNAPALALPFLPSQVAGSEQLKAPVVDKAVASKLLDSAKWKLAGDKRVRGKETLSLKITTLKNQLYEDIATEVAAELKSIGIDTTIQVIDTEAVSSGFVQDVLQARNYDILIYELPIGGDPDVFAYWHSSQTSLSGYNFTNYANDTSDVALVSARDQIDDVRRDGKYVAFAKQWLKDAPAIALYQQVAPYFVNQNASSINDSMRFVSIADRYSTVNGWTVNRGQVLKTP